MDVPVMAFNGVTALDRAIEVWGTAERAKEWLETECARLHAKPIDVATNNQVLRNVLLQLRKVELELGC